MNRIAIVDDNEINLTLIKALVGKLGDCEAEAFADSSTGLDWCCEHRPDLVIVDYMMPVMDGMEFIRRLRRVWSVEDLPVLMITANDDRQVRYQALQIGATDFLIKPIDRIEFDARVRTMLALGGSRRKLADRASWLAEEVKKATAVIQSRERELLFRMSRAAEFRDPDTGQHIQRIVHYAALIARAMGLPEDEQHLVEQAAPLHDMGKIGIPDYILLKPGALSSSEFDLMKTHARLGYELLKDSESAVLQAAATIALTHHERFDGSGYPDGLAGEAIPLFGRIVGVVDVFDALTSERPYKTAWPMEKAADFLHQGAGRHFDPECVLAFLAHWPEILTVGARYQGQSNFLSNI